MLSDSAELAVTPLDAGLRDQAEEVARLYPLVYRLFHTSHQALPGTDVTPRMLGVLQHLAAAGPLSLSELVLHLGLSKAATTELIDRLAKAGASDIAFDVDFSSASTPAADQAFAEALVRAGGSVILPTFKQLVGERGGAASIHVNRPLPQFAQHAWLAAINVEPDADKLVRRYPPGQTIDDAFVPSVGALLAGAYGGLSGPAVRPVAVRCVWQVAEAFPDVPIIGTGGVCSGRDALELLLAGASMIGVGSALIHDPSACSRIGHELEEVLAAIGVDRVADIIGQAHGGAPKVPRGLAQRI